MHSFRWWVLFCILIILVGGLAVGCSQLPPSTPETTATLTAISEAAVTTVPAAWPTHLPTPSVTPTSSPYPTHTPSATATPLPTVTPTVWPVVKIEAANAVGLQELARWGRGVIEHVTVVPESQVIIVRTPYGLSLYRVEPLQQFALLAEVENFWTTPDGLYLLTTYAGSGLIKIWDLADGSLSHSLEHAAAPPKYPDRWFNLDEFLAVRSWGFSIDNRLMAVAYGDNQVALFDVHSWEPRALLTSNVAPEVSTISFSHDGQYLATSGRALGIWRLSDGKLLTRLPNAGRISRNPFSADGSMFVTADFGAILVWTFPGGDLLYTFATPSQSDVVFTSDSRCLIVDRHQVRCLPGGDRLRTDIETKLLQAELTASGDASRDQPATIKVDQEALAAHGHYAGIQGLALGTGRSILAWGVLDRDLYLWNVLADQVEHFELSAQPVNTAIMSPGASQLALCLPNQIQVINPGANAQTLGGRCKPSGALVFSPGQAVLARANELLVDLVNTANGQVEHNLRGHEDIITALAFSPDGRYLASGTRVSRSGAEVFLWKLDPLSFWQRWTVTSAVMYAESGLRLLAFSPDSSMLVTAGIDRYVKLWRVGDAWQLKIMKTEQRAFSLAFSPDGSLLAAGDQNGQVFLWSIPDGQELAVLPAGRDAVVGLMFAPDGSALVSASQDGTVRLWGVP